MSLTLPLAIGTALDRPAYGALAAIGAFTAMYSQNRPYRQRTRRWLLIAALLLLSFAAGLATGASLWGGIIVIGVVAAVTTFATKVMGIGPPAGYMLVLACATGTHLPPDLSAAPGRLTLVALGAVGAFLVCSAGWFAAPDGPERRAVAEAARAVATVLRSRGADSHAALEQAAYRAIHEANIAVILGSERGDRGRLIRVLQALRDLVDPKAREESEQGDGVEGAAADEVDRIATCLLGSWPLRREVDPGSVGGTDAAVPLADLRAALAAAPGTSPSPRPFPGPLSLWRKRSPRALRSGLRAGVAATAAGCVAVALQVDRPYWGAAAAVAVLAGDGTRATLVRGWNRFAGTVVGVLLAGGIIAMEPDPVAIVVIVAGLQFVIQLVIKRSYGLAVVAITPLALLLADAATGTLSTGDLLPRLLETAIGCALALLSRFLIFPNSSAKALPSVLASVERRLLEWTTAAGLPAPVREERRLAVERALLSLHDAVEAAKDEMFPHPGTTALIDTANELLARAWPLVTTTTG
ncbi:FUSC family protein [Nakamurella silvestris]|nr:FUSC family protein [Nakamurella silvestris]